MRRREFITLFGGAATAPLLLPLAARAQPRKLPTIGFSGVSTPAAWKHWVAAFTQRLGELGWAEGRTVAIEYRWAEGREERFAEIAAEFVRLKVDVIFVGGAAIPATKLATSELPIVFILGGDPVGTGLVASLARPGGNVTGLSSQATEIASKRLAILREAWPGLRRPAIVANPGNPASVTEMVEAQAAARSLGLEAISVDIRQSENIAPALGALKNRADALYVCGDAMFFHERVRMNSLALDMRLPTMFVHRDYAQAGALLSYGPNYLDLFRRGGDIVDKILRGTKPGDIPIEQPTKFELVVNLKTAKALGLTISESFLLRADEVIE